MVRLNMALALVASLLQMISAHECPVCGMDTNDVGYENRFFVTLANGQKILTCGMEPRKFKAYPNEKHTDTEYLAANMAEFIKGDGDCAAGCPECQNGLKDPVNGDAVTSDNFRSVCLAKGQKIYFASDATKAQYLYNVGRQPHYQVATATCDLANCEDALQIGAVSPAAAEFSKKQPVPPTPTTVPPTPTTPAPTSGPTPTTATPTSGPSPTTPAPVPTTAAPKPTTPGQTTEAPKPTTPGQTTEAPKPTTPGQTTVAPKPTTPGQTTEALKPTTPGSTTVAPKPTTPGATTTAPGTKPAPGNNSTTAPTQKPQC